MGQAYTDCTPHPQSLSLASRWAQRARFEGHCTALRDTQMRREGFAQDGGSFVVAMRLVQIQRVWKTARRAAAAKAC